MIILLISILCLVLCFVLYLTTLRNTAISPTFNEEKEDAEKGNAQAQFNVGLMYAKGQGVAQDYTKAKAWLEKAADQGLAQAQTSLGALYAQGLGVVQDYTKAKPWYEKAAAQGFADGQTSLGTLYAQGQGVAQDFAKAKAWFEKAAAQGERLGKAQFNLGVLYYEGLGVVQDFAKAKVWFEKAADKGNTEAQYNLGILYGEGQGVAQDYTKAKAWLEKAAAQGFAPAQEALKKCQLVVTCSKKRIKIMGLFGLIRRLAFKGYSQELTVIINTLSEDSTEKVASILVYGVWLRALLEIEGNLLILRDDNEEITPELHSYPIMVSGFKKWISIFKKKGYHARSFAFLIWVHTLRSFYRPELSNQVKHMWDILMKSKPHWDRLLVELRDEDIELGIPADMVLKTEKHAKAILRCLPPKQLS